MIFLQRTRIAAAGLLALLTLAFLTTFPASAQVDRGNLVVDGSATPDFAGGDPTPAGGASQVTYTITVKNDSTVTATGVAVTMDMADGVQFVRCTPSSVVCQPPSSPAGIVTTTFASIAAHVTAKVNLVVTMPVVSQETILSLAILAHADHAIGGEEPRDGTKTIEVTVLPPTARLQMSPTRTVSVRCGGTVDATMFGADTEGVLLDGLVCNNGSGLTFTAAGKILNLGGKKIYSGQRVTGNAGIIVGPNAPNVTIKGGGLQGTRGVEQFEYCIKDLGGNTRLHIADLRCYRAKGAGILTLSDGVLIESSLIDNTIPDSKIEVPGGGIGIQAGGDNLDVEDTIVRRSKNIGFWAYGVDTDGSGVVSTYDGTYEGTAPKSRIERNFGVGALLSGGPHHIRNTQVQGDDNTPVTSKEGIVVTGDAQGTVLDKVIIKKHLGDAIRVDTGAMGTVISRTSVEGIGGRGYLINGPSTLNGNSATEVAGDAFVINTTATLTSNNVEKVSGNAFVINGPGLVDGNSAVDNDRYGFVLTNAFAGSMGVGWSVQGVGDFDGNGSTDILWGHTSGAAAIWLMNATGTGTLSTSTYNLGRDWSVQDVGDFNGDGKADILWRHSSGLVHIWLMNGTSVIGAGSPSTILGRDWAVQGVGDFNGDGRSDILWRQSSGLVSIWLMDGTTMISNTPLGTVGPDWTVEGVADFNGDRKADVLWRHSTGFVYVWVMNGTSIISADTPGSVGPDWVIQSTGDFNGDGKADVLWRHSTGLVYIWLMNGHNVIGAGSPGSVDTDSTVRGVGDLNGDGKADVIWSRGGGELSTWFMNGTGIPTVSGAARLRSNSAEGNILGGYLVSGSGNVLDNNDAKGNGGKGFDITGSRNVLNTEKAERSAGPELVIGPNNIDDGNNAANGTRFTFSAAGGTFE